MFQVYVVLCFVPSFYLGTCQFEEFKTVTEMIIECGENVRRVIQEPEYDSRGYVIRELAKYYHLLDQVDEKIRYKDHDAMEILETVYNQGGPPHLNIHIDYDALQRHYKFKDGLMKDVRTLLNDTRELWEKLVNLLPEEKKQFHQREQNGNQEDAIEISKGEVQLEDNDGGQIDFMNNDEEVESRGQIDLITDRDNDGEEETIPSAKNNDEDGNEPRKQNDWFNEEK